MNISAAAFPSVGGIVKKKISKSKIQTHTAAGEE
jgi:hypothetical protein